MKVDLKSWSRWREEALAELARHRGEGRVDPDMDGLLDLINSLGYAFTTSSCSGRIQLYEADEPGDKFGLRTLAKWHEPVSLEEFLDAIRVPPGSLWLAVLPPLLHIVTCSVDAAFRTLELVRRAGFKRAGIISASDSGLTVEAMGTERLEAPLRLAGREVVRDDSLQLLLDRANSLLRRSKGRLSRLEEVLKDELSGGVDNLCGK